MRLKHALAAGLSLLLLCASSLVSACELSCSLASSHPVSSPASNAKVGFSTAPASESADSAMRMPHSHCGHAKMARRGSAVPHLFEDASTCDRAPCTQAQILSSPVSGKGRVLIESKRLAVPAIISPVGTISKGSYTVNFEHAPPALVLLDRLSVALRI